MLEDCNSLSNTPQPEYHISPQGVKPIGRPYNDEFSCHLGRGGRRAWRIRSADPRRASERRGRVCQGSGPRRPRASRPTGRWSRRFHFGTPHRCPKVTYLFTFNGSILNGRKTSGKILCHTQ